MAKVKSGKELIFKDDFLVCVGYYEYDVYRNGDFLTAVDDPTEDLMRIMCKKDLKSYCRDVVNACVIERVREEDNIILNLSKKEYNSLVKQFYDLFLPRCNFEDALLYLAAEA